MTDVFLLELQALMGPSLATMTDNFIAHANAVQEQRRRWKLAKRRQRARARRSKP